MKTRTLLSSFCLLLLCQGALSGNDIHVIHSASELIQFSNTVSAGTSYSVTLDADIDFSGGLSQQFVSIGKYYNGQYKPFQGTFDGNGYTISNLMINSSSQYVGLFGYSS